MSFLLIYTPYSVQGFFVGSWAGASAGGWFAACGAGCPRGSWVPEAPGAADVDCAGLCAATGFLATGLFFSTNALAAGFLLRTGAGPPAFGVVELGPEGGVGMELLFMVRIRARVRARAGNVVKCGCDNPQVVVSKTVVIASAIYRGSREQLYVD
jgi:hypothetical protein